MSDKIERIGCIPVGVVEGIGKTKGYFNKIAGRHTMKGCLEKAKNLGYLCRGNNQTQGCEYVGRPTELNAREEGDCYVIGYGDRDKMVDFNRTIMDHALEKQCETNQKLLSIYTTNPNLHRETQKREINTEMKDLEGQIQTNQKKLKSRSFQLAGLFGGKSPAEVEAQIKREEAMKGILEYQKQFDETRKKGDMYKRMAEQKQAWEKERQKTIGKNKKTLSSLENKIKRMWKQISYNQDLYQWNDRLILYLKVGIILLALAVVGFTFYWNYAKIYEYGKAVTDKIHNTVGEWNLDLPEVEGNWDLKLRNIKNL